MKTIKIFLASSEELDYDRMVFGNLVRRLDDMYEKRGIRIKLFEWEDYDAAFNDRRKQDEYNDHVRDSDVFFALFHKKAGKFTIEEFDIASEEFKQHASPKVFTFCKDLQPGEEESPELAEFKKRLFEEMGHYWCRYDSRESLQLQFVMQIQLVESNQMGQLKVEDGNVTMDGIRIAPMDKLRFAAANEDYVKMQTEISELHDEIEDMQLNLEKKQQKLEKKKARLEKDPEDEEYQEEYQEVKEEVDELVDKLQPKLNKYNKLKEDLGEYQKLLFDTAKRVAHLQGERITERMRRAMDAFSEGKVREANIILDEAEADARRNLEDYKQSKEITELKRQAVISSIEELALKASTLMADASIPIDARIAQTEQIYVQADEMAKETEYDNEKYVKLLFDYGYFLYAFGKYEKAIDVLKRQIAISELLYGSNSEHTVVPNDWIGQAFLKLDDYSNAMQYLQNAFAIRNRIFGSDHPETAFSYNNIGLLHSDLGNSSIALEYYFKALRIWEETIGTDNAEVATVYNNIGVQFAEQDGYEKAMEYCKKALEIQERIYGLVHYETAKSYNNLAYLYQKQGEHENALEYYFNALKTWGQIIGMNHPDIASVYDNIGLAYTDQGNYTKALEYEFRALELRERVLGMNHTDTALSNNNIGLVYSKQGMYNKALEYYFKALDVWKTVYGHIHPKVAVAYENIGQVYNDQGNFSEEIDYYAKALSVRETLQGEENYIKSGILNGNIGVAYRKTGEHEKALQFFLKYLNYCIKTYGESQIRTANAYHNVGCEFRDIGQYETAIEYIEKALDISQKLDSTEDVADFHNRLGRIYALMNNKEAAIEHFQLSIEMLPEDHQVALDSKERIKNLNL